MKTEKNIFFAFILNLVFSVFEFFGGIFTGSVAILSDAIHDIGDAFSIGLAFLFEKKSKKQPDKNYTYGYARYSVIGSVITTLILLFGSASVTYNAVKRIITPVTVDYNGMIIFAVVGVIVNAAAVFLTRGGDSLNQKAVNLHILEDVLGWVVVLIGSIVMRFTDFSILDPIISIGVSVFIVIGAIAHLKEAVDLFMEKTPHGIDVQEITNHVCEIDDVIDVHHVHVWSLDGHTHYATMHVVANGNPHEIKERVREELKEHGITHVTLEIESEGECCGEECCHVEHSPSLEHHHHHHHH